MPGGRPTKYDDKYCEEIIDFMSKGYSIEAFAGHIGIAKDTLYNWVKKYPQFSDAKKIAESKARLVWDKFLMNQFTGAANLPFNSTAWVFTMKNRFGWRDRQEVELPDISVDLNYKLVEDDE